VVPSLPPAPPLPRPATRFFGREEEQLRLGWLLRTPSTRLVTLVGPGGAGKTRLALEVVRELGVPNELNRAHSEYAEEVDGSERAVYFLPLSDLADAAHLPAALASAVGLPEDPKAGDPIARIVNLLARMSALLIIDNAEHLIDDVTALVRTLLERLPLLTCLVTSRQRLQLPEEVVCTVGALVAPVAEGDGAASTVPADPAEQVQEFPAIALFVDRAQRTRPDFQLTPRNMNAVVRLVTELEGFPLAIELAAARAFLLSPSQMVEQLQQHRFDLLKRRGDAPGRQDSLWNTMDWSIRLLPEGTRQLLAHLSIFRGGWSLDAAYRVVGEEIPLDDLALLVDASLVEMRLMPGPDDEDETARYYLLETVREFAREMLSATSASELTELSTRHAAWLVDLTEETEPNLRGARQAFWLDRLMRERDNLRTAFAWCVSAGKASAVVLGLRIFCAGHRFYLVRGVDEGRRHYRAILAAVNHLPENERDGMVERLATARNAAGVLALTQGDLGDAREQFTECLTLRRQSSDMRGMATVLNNLALVEMEEDHLNEAIAYQTDSLEIWRKLGEDRLVAMVQCNIGVVAMRLDDYAKARSLFTESLNYALKTGDIRSAALRRFNLGEAANRSGDLRQAETQFRDCLRDFYTLGDTRSCALCVLNLGFVAASRREWRTATRRIGAGLSWCQENGMQFTPRWQSDLDKNIAAIEEALGIEVGIALRDVRPSSHPALSEIIAELLSAGGNQSGKTFGGPFRPLSA
jgi:predicted ATPase